MATEVPEPVAKWGKLVENSILTSFYRQLSFVSLHAPIDEVYDTCAWLSENSDLEGSVFWLIPERLFEWDGVVVNQNPDYPVSMTIRVFGSPTRRANTVFFRAGWLFMWITGPFIDRVLGWFGDVWKSVTGWR